MTPAPTRFPVAGDVVALTLYAGALHVLLVERKFEPYQGSFAFPGGFVEPGEQLADAALRELAEETGVVVAPELFVQLGAYGVGGRDPRGDTVGVVFIAVSPDFGVVQAGDDAAAAAWHPVQTVLASGSLAFDHDRILGDALHRTAAEFGAPDAQLTGFTSEFLAEFRAELMSVVSSTPQS